MINESKTSMGEDHNVDVINSGVSRIRLAILEKIQDGTCQAQLAREIGITRAYLNNILAGRRHPKSVKLLTKIATIVGCEVSELI